MEEKPEIKKEDKKAELKELVERMEKANAESRELLQKHEDLVVKKLLGGGTDATPQPEKKEETPQEYVKRIMSGGK